VDVPFSDPMSLYELLSPRMPFNEETFAARYANSRARCCAASQSVHPPEGFGRHLQSPPQSSSIQLLPISP
jgi:hypothetical protein